MFGSLVGGGGTWGPNSRDAKSGISRVIKWFGVAHSTPQGLELRRSTTLCCGKAQSFNTIEIPKEKYAFEMPKASKSLKFLWGSVLLQTPMLQKHWPSLGKLCLCFEKPNASKSLNPLRISLQFIRKGVLLQSPRLQIPWNSSGKVCFCKAQCFKSIEIVEEKHAFERPKASKSLLKV